MNTLTLVVLAQLAVPLVPAEPAQPAVSVVTEQAAANGPLHWVITTPILGAFAGAAAGFTASSFGPEDNVSPLWGMLIGAAVGAGVGLIAGHFAREGSLAGKISSVALWVLGSSAITTVVAFGGATALLFSGHLGGGRSNTPFF